MIKVSGMVELSHTKIYILSQDEERVETLSRLRIMDNSYLEQENKTVIYKHVQFHVMGDNILGSYPSELRAKEVVREICDAINGLDGLQYHVLHMPKE